MNFETCTKYSAAYFDIMMSCTFSSHVWFSSVSGFPVWSLVYPSCLSFSMVVPISFGLKCVSGASVMSNLVVPSLNTCILCLALSIPFSSGSGVLFFDIVPMTPFIVSGSVLSLMFFCAFLSSSVRFMVCVSIFPLFCFVCVPQVHVSLYVFLLHFGQILVPASTSILGRFAAFLMSLWFPP